MKVSYQLDEDAVLAFNEYGAKHSSSFQQLRWLGRLVMVPCMGAYVLWAWSAGVDLLCPIAMALTVSVLWFALYPRMQSLQGKRFVRRLMREGTNRGVFGEYTLKVTPEYLQSTSSGSEKKYAWHRIQRVESTNDHLFIYETSISAIVVPRVSLAGASFDELRDQVVEYHSASVASQYDDSAL